jgi:hypothetical protein
MDQLDDEENAIEEKYRRDVLLACLICGSGTLFGIAKILSVVF